jgi:hypothetical protein
VLILVALLGVAFLAVGTLALVNTHRLHVQTEQQREAVCALVLGSIQRDRANHQPISPLVIQFGQSYHCTPPVVPPPGVGG